MTAALIMSVFLIGSSFATTLLIPAAEFQPGGAANGRALAYLAHEYLGERLRHALRPLDDQRSCGSPGPRRWRRCSTWCRATCPPTAWRPTGRGPTGRWCSSSPSITFAVTILFKADVDAQGGAYATGVLVLMTSAAVAVTIAHRDSPWRWRLRADDR